ncbi:MAG TPA: hypothetical protein VEA36_01210 [Candidatus Paceibacterota bacterium]|nr:hypothetical protein [Candidatus Paceibacterota bacterium]
MYLRTRLVQVGEPAWTGEFHEGATLGDVVEAAGATVGDRALSQNGRRASASDPVQPDSMVMLGPNARHG